MDGRPGRSASEPGPTGQGRAAGAWRGPRARRSDRGGRLLRRPRGLGGPSGPEERPGTARARPGPRRGQGRERRPGTGGGRGDAERWEGCGVALRGPRKRRTGAGRASRRCGGVEGRTVHTESRVGGSEAPGWSRDGDGEERPS